MTDYAKAKYYATLDGFTTCPDDPDEEVWTISRDPKQTGWTTDSGCSGYGLKKAEADYLVACANENALLKQKLKIATNALKDISFCFWNSKIAIERYAYERLLDVEKDSK